MRSGRTISPLLGLLAAASTTPALAFNQANFNGMVTTFRNYGFEVVSTHQRCLMEPNLFGLYLRGTRRIVVCPRGNQLDTLMHEGWHAVQARCRKGKPLLTEQYLRANLSRADLRDIDALYSAKSWHREAEARAMAAQQIPLYMSHLEASCGAPQAAGGIAQPPAPGATPQAGAVSPSAAPATAPAAAAPPQPQPAAAPAAPAPQPAQQLPSSQSLPGLLQRGLPLLLP
jgi:hypothetical protein